MALPPLVLEPTSELDAVNNLLLSIGQSPVNTLHVPGVKDVSIARMSLHDTSREVQGHGWWFNTDTNYPLMPDSQGRVMLPPNALQVIPQSTEVTERGGGLYDRTRRSFLFPTGVAVNCTVRWFFPFEELPQAARNYIQRRAGRIFQTNIVASRILYEFTKELEVEALAEMQRNDLRVNRPNFFNSASTTNTIFQRR